MVQIIRIHRKHLTYIIKLNTINQKIVDNSALSPNSKARNIYKVHEQQNLFASSKGDTASA